MANKFHAKPTVVDGIRFASKREGARYGELKLLLKAGKISDLKLQPRIRCVVNGEHVCDVVPDFFYIDRATFKEVYEDSKGVRTAMFKLKKKLANACAGIEIKEV